MAVKRTGPGVQALAKDIQKLKRKKLSIGFFDTAKYPDGTPVAYVAAIQEYGTSSIPPRPFFRPAIQENRQKWVDLLSKGLDRVIKGELDIDTVFSAVGEAAIGDIKKSISRVNTPALKADTIKARRSRKINPNQSVKPLIDTGKMFDSVEYVVTED